MRGLEGLLHSNKTTDGVTDGLIADGATSRNGGVVICIERSVEVGTERFGMAEMTSRPFIALRKDGIRIDARGNLDEDVEVPGLGVEIRGLQSTVNEITGRPRLPAVVGDERARFLLAGVDLVSRPQRVSSAVAKINSPSKELKVSRY